MAELQIIQQYNWRVKLIIVDGETWFKGKDVANILGYNDPTQAIRKNVEDDDKRKLDELRGVSETPLDWNTKNALYLNESGLYSLILRSGKAEAKQFSRWITKEVLPSIRKTGKYVMQDPIIETNKYLEILENKAGYDESMIHADHVINISDEKSLHYHVVDYIRRFHPNMIFNDFGGHQVHKSEDTTIDPRLDRWNSGYSKGSCDLIILNYHKQHQSLCIEFKNPRGTGNLTSEQIKWLAEMKTNGHEVLISNDYDHIIKFINEYSRDIRF